ncbi:glycosyltransferase family 4 protein [Streptomyces sp. TRM66268-LWL]|uniref:Glycosyltransferase family 4 protein n=1 Tax=Streptomyces polyasparticus TaxID=2767826 RepID=A0ABR7SVS4_9ACTN|nr:glycosyltransferase family 1 protein [Streptomyces polyasparticus]MBC9719616.1 glycosyltransferase family 4 protein [Streptomyces polyasparticus]
MTRISMPTPSLNVAVSAKAFTSNLGGNTSYARSIYGQLEHLGVKPHLLTPPQPQWTGIRRKVLYTAAESFMWPRRSSCHDMDVLHYPTDTGALVPSVAPIVATVHGVEDAPVPGLKRSLWKKFWLARVRRLLKVADTVITVSRHSAMEIEAAFGYPSSRIHVIPHGVAHDRFHPDSSRDASVIGHLGLPERFVFYLGNLDPRKNAHLLAQAINDPLLASFDVQLVVAGGSFLGSEALERSLHADPRVKHLGQVPDEWVAPLMRAADAYVLPSAHEGFGMPVLEAMACGTPAIVSDRAALPEVAGDAGRVVSELTGCGIAKALHSVLADEDYAAEIAERGIERASRFTWEESAARHYEIFESVSQRR